MRANASLAKEAFVAKGLKALVSPKAVKALNSFVDKGLKQSRGKGAPPARIWKALKEQSIEGSGPDSLLAWPFITLAEKIVGKQKVRTAIWNRLGRPAMKTDIALGRVGQKIPLIGKKMFTENIKVPWDVKKGIYKDIQRSSALAPLTKVKGFAEPIVMMAAAEKGLKAYGDLSKQRKEQLRNFEQGSDKMKKHAQLSDKLKDRELREKVASAMVSLHKENEGHKKRAHATRLLYKQVEHGSEVLPHTYSEFEEKIASLMEQDLLVLERALELIGGSEKLGELGSSADPTAAQTPSEKFQADILEVGDFV